MLTGEKPKVLPIMPYGCKAFPVKPRSAYSKTEIESRAWSGINLGRAAHTPGAYDIWLPTEAKVVTTSEVYFDEGLMPWRPKGDQRVGDPLPVAPPVDEDQPPGIPAHAPPEPTEDTGKAPSSMEQAYAAATRLSLIHI